MTQNDTLPGLFAAHGFTVEDVHVCLYTGNGMRSFYRPNDPYGDTGCYIDMATGEVEIDIAGGCEFFGPADDPALPLAVAKAASA